ncbi:hypothetical protein Daus18300_007003 [Diaporthe australafricana]|uniref:Uncharacterized protein n=1 Tax=Diaporthe australafricana TaxID=127596 RepID=A0ABR3WQF8_9PEZI
MPEDKKNDTSILGFAKDEVQLVLMSVQCIKPNKRVGSGWEVGMKKFADLTNVNIVTARAQWKELNGRLMKLPRLTRESSPLNQDAKSEDIIEDCIIVGERAAAAADNDRDEEDERETKDKVNMKGKRRQIAKLSMIDNDDYDLDEEDQSGGRMTSQLKGKGKKVAKPSISGDSTEQAWADIGDGMSEEMWNQMGGELAL